MMPGGWSPPSLSVTDIIAAAPALAVLRDLADAIRRIDSTTFTAAQFDSSRLMNTIRTEYPDIADSLPAPPRTPIGLDQITSAERSELDRLPRHTRRSLAREVIDAASKATGCGALRNTPLSRIQHFAPLFAVWQRVKWRLIYDLRSFNSLSDDPHFRMETLADVPLIARGCLVGGKLDLKSAYWQVPLGLDLSAYMGCTVNNIAYTWRALPFGLAMAPRLFTDTIRPLLLAWRAIGIRVIVYLDDIAVFAPDVQTYARHMSIVIRDLQASGLRIAADKSFLTPHSRFELLGLMIDLDAQAFSVAPDRAHSISSEARSILQSSSPPTALDTTSLLGRIAFASLACPWLAFFRASLTSDTAAACPSAFDPNAPVNLSHSSRTELQWWSSHSIPIMTRQWRWSSICTTTVYSKRGCQTPIPQFSAASDASTNGVGLRFGDRGTHVIDEPLPDWLPPSAPSAAREIYGLARLVEAGNFPRRSSVRLIVDAQAAVGTWAGPSVTPLTARAARRLFLAVTAADIDVRLDWMPRDELFDVDEGSRRAADDLSHAMAPSSWIRNALQRAFGNPVADAELFSSSHNRAFPSVPCGSRRPDPAATLGDGVSSQAWLTAKRGWAFPPFSLTRVVISRVTSLPRTPAVAILLPDVPLTRCLSSHFRLSPGPTHLLAPPSFKRLVPSPRPLVLCSPR